MHAGVSVIPQGHAEMVREVRLKTKEHAPRAGASFDHFLARMAGKFQFLSAEVVVSRRPSQDILICDAKSEVIPEALYERFSFSIPRGWKPGEYDLSPDREPGKFIRFGYAHYVEHESGGIIVSIASTTAGSLRLEKVDDRGVTAGRFWAELKVRMPNGEIRQVKVDEGSFSVDLSGHPLPPP